MVKLKMLKSLMMENKKVNKYFNRKQLEWMSIAAKNEYIVASRGFGKSEGVDAPRLLRNIHAMPRSAGAILSPTYAKLLQNTLPAVAHALERMGYKRNVHYYIGRKPPKNSGFKTPYINPFSYDHVMSWYNGSIINLISFDRSMSTNSMNLDYILGFEAKFLDYDKIKNEVLPANRGNIHRFGDCPWHHGQIYSTDRPTNKKGMWIEDKENEVDQELILHIKSLYSEYLRLKHSSKQSSHYLRKLNKTYKELQFFRSKATFYGEANVIDNLEILGEEFIANMKRDLPNIIFQTAILNKKLRKVPNGFYSALDEYLHYYSYFDNSYLDSLDYNLSKSSKPDCRHDADIIKDKPLIIANDYNAAINSLVCGQVTDDRRLKTLKSMYVKTPRKLPEVCNDWCDYYEYMPHKDVIFYYDSTAIWDTPLHTESFKDTVVNVLSKRGWNVISKYIGQPINHSVKHMMIDKALKGDPNYLFPEFNQDNCEYLILALEQTGIKVGAKGFEKDKSAEKEPDSPDNPDELKTHITDAWDTLFVGCNNHPTSLSGFTAPTSFPK